MVRVASIRGGHSAVCVDGCGKSYTVPLSRLPAGTVVGSQVSIEAVLGLAAGKPRKEQGTEQGEKARGELTAGLDEGGRACSARPVGLGIRDADNARVSTTSHRMTVVEVRNRVEAVLVSETGATTTRSVFSLPGRIRPGDVLLVAGDRAGRNPSSERWNDAQRRDALERAQQLRLHPVGNDAMNQGSSGPAAVTGNPVRDGGVARRPTAETGAGRANRYDKTGDQAGWARGIASPAELERLRDEALDEIEQARVALRQAQLEVMHADENTWTAFREGTDEAAAAARHRLDASCVRETTAREKLRSSNARYRQLQEEVDRRRNELVETHRLVETQKQERLRLAALAEDHRLRAEDATNRRLLQSVPDHLSHGAVGRGIRVKPAAVNPDEARKLFGEN